ncbi:hypothetical protein [Hymenobacter armeniacus]|uniref:Uncharacterized protein n=1 Tax=Hymenobacter armeniacus TaxID=2771358 RepID=A0ABR8JZD7_9BACT|nr:hypothetical protein [Hymenobacter armeniacus]MBD2723174.1 hypothetical protein [Hymenobacter armeniacus]
MEELPEAVFAVALERLVVGTQVATVKAGVGTGSIFSLHLQPTSGEVRYLMVYCAWKLLRTGRVACTWQDAEAYLAAALSAHEGEVVASAQMASGGDVALTLRSGAELKLFVDSSAQDAPLNASNPCDYFVEAAEGIFSCIRGAYYREEASSARPQNV